MPLVAVFGGGRLLNELQKGDASGEYVAVRASFVFQQLARKINTVALFVVPGGSANTESKIADFQFSSSADEDIP